jgi:CO/xanthine dehydrogenase FAD-binding subunit
VRFTTAASLDDALGALAGGARPIAGGSDLVVGARQGKAPLPQALVAIHALAELGGITADDEGGVRIGALASHAAIEHDPVLRERFSALADGSALVGSPSTRHVGTLGGNVMNGSPAMDTGAPLVVLGAQVDLRSAVGARRLGIEELWAGPGKTRARADELCVRVTVPALPPRSGSAYVRLEYRRAMEIAIVGAAALVTFGEDDTVSACRVALAAVAPTIIRAPGAEAAVTGAYLGEDTLAAVAAGASEAAQPIDDLRGSAGYRRHTIGVVARRAVEIAARRARGEAVPVPANRAFGVGTAFGGAA